MSNLTNNRPRGFSRQALRFCGILFLVLGIAGRAIIQNKLLGIGQIKVEDLEILLENPDNMGMATVAILIMLIQSCAIPIFSFLLVEGFCHTESLKNYFLRVAGLALLTEIPYNFAMSGKLLDTSSRNPVIGLAISMVVLYLYRYYSGKSFKNVIIKVFAFLMAMLWMLMFDITDGAATLMVVVTLWLTRNKSGIRIMAGCVAMFAASIFSPFYLVAPASFLAIHLYNDEPGEGSRWVNYFAYPALLLAIGLVAKYAF